MYLNLEMYKINITIEHIFSFKNNFILLFLLKKLTNLKSYMGKLFVKDEALDIRLQVE